ncbi:MAG: 2-hydroxyacyl-CoA dehydratase family protein [Propionibacterium sp.]|nr:2-hydroxyacyl-CoA dehydratase family protein [Propionibacterium sp.]MDN6793628.1 2-hydroxyacyl-CoA dehydratase family protein [Propionibacterium sp.]
MSSTDEVFAAAHEAAASPRARLDAYLAQGRTVIGCLPEYTPVELIHSLGLIPFGVWGADRVATKSARYFPTFYCGLLQTALDLGIEGGYEGLTAVVIPNLCDQLKATGQNWKYAVPDIPFIPMSYPQNRRTPAGRAFTRASYQRVIDALEKLTGTTFDEGALQHSLDVYNAHNALMRRFSELAASHADVVTPSRRSDVFKSAYFMTPEEHSALVAELVGLLEGSDSDSPAIPIVTTGILADAPGLLDILDREGFSVVADNVAHESRQYLVDATTGEDALEKLVDKYASMGNCSLLFDPGKGRAEHLVDLVTRRHAKGVVFVMTKFCDPEEFDYVPVKAVLDEKGIPSVSIEVDRQMDRLDQAEIALETFRDLVGV